MAMKTCNECKYNKKHDGKTGRCMRDPVIFLFTKHVFSSCHYFEAGKYAEGISAEPVKETVGATNV